MVYRAQGNGKYEDEFKLVGSAMELYGLSTETKPTQNVIKGTTFFEINTSTVYMWNGTTWVVI